MTKDDLISRQAAIDALKVAYWDDNIQSAKDDPCIVDTMTDWAIRQVKALPSARPEIKTDGDTISRQQTIDTLMQEFRRIPTNSIRAKLVVENLPSAQPERTCVNCGRTANNGGWYADGGTRCPIEEHYALPKDGYWHLWEKRNVTDDDYPERRTDG